MSETTNAVVQPRLSIRLIRMMYQSRRRIGTALAIVFALFLGYHVMMGRNGLTSYQQKRREDHDLQLDIQQLQEENSRLKEHVDRLQNDPDAIEHEARERLHYARPGEVIYTLPEKQSAASVTAK
jgi:cell division protein FtsB